MTPIFSKPYIAGSFLLHLQLFEEPKAKEFLLFYEATIYQKSSNKSLDISILFNRYINSDAVLSVRLPCDLALDGDRSSILNEICECIYSRLETLYQTFVKDLAEDAACTEDFLSINNNKEKFEKVMASLQTRASDAENESFYLLERFLFFFYDLNIKVDMKEYMETVKLTPAELKQQPYLWLSNSASLSELSDEWDLCSPSEHVENNAECEAEQVNTIKTSARPLSTASLTNYCVSDILEVLSLEKDYESWVAKVPKDILKKTKKDEVKRQELIYELFKTERNFLSAMVALKEVFQDSIILKDLLKTEKVYSIFANLDDIVMLSYQMHRRMKGKAMREYVVSTIDDLFDEQFESYKSFAIFCSNQPIAKDILHLERKKSPALDQFLIEAERDPRCNRMKMEDMFIMPMQRITRYNLFLQNLYEKSKNAKDKERIYSCLSRVAGVLSYVNTRTKRVGNIYELKKLQDMLVLENNVKLDLCDSPRDFIRQGELIVNSAVSVEEIKKYATKHSKNAYSVEGADKKKDGQESLKKTIIVLNDMVIIGTLSKNKLIVKDEPLLFTEVHVTDGIGGGSLKSFFLLNKTKNSLTEFVCFSVAEKKAWINVISTAAKEACLAQLPMK